MLETFGTFLDVIVEVGFVVVRKIILIFIKVFIVEYDDASQGSSDGFPAFIKQLQVSKLDDIVDGSIILAIQILTAFTDLIKNVMVEFTIAKYKTKINTNVSRIQQHTNLFPSQFLQEC